MDLLAVTQAADADERARETEARMTDEERLALLGVALGAVPALPHLGLPALRAVEAKGATAFPAPLAVGASFSPRLAGQVGAAMAREARARGFNLQPSSGILLARDPRNGGNFECYSEDPYLSGVLAAEAVNGIEREGVLPMLAQWTGEASRHWVDALIDPAASRESDALVAQLALERSRPAAIAGAAEPAFDPERLRKAYADGKIARDRLAELVRRTLRSLYSAGVDQWGPTAKIDRAQSHALALDAARQGIVLLRNLAVLPLPADQRLRIAVIGGHAQEGVVSAGGSSAAAPAGGIAGMVHIGGPGTKGALRNLLLLPPAPLAELKKLLPRASIEFDPGYTPAEAAQLARRSDVVVVFAIRAEGEGFDNADLSLPWGQDSVINACATANPSTVVVLQTGNAVAMPWRSKVKAILQAWYPGEAGAQAIAEVLTGKANPSGRLPVTYPESLAQTPRPKLPDLGTPWGAAVTIRYNEGAELGYRWHSKKNARPLYPFGHGLSYTSFAYADLWLQGGETLVARFTVTNTGRRTGADVPQLYLVNGAGERRMRLLGFERVELKPGETRRLAFKADARLLARFDAATRRWRIADGTYRVALGRSAGELELTACTRVWARQFAK